MGTNDRHKKTARLFGIAMPPVLLIDGVIDLTAIVQAVRVTYTKIDLADTTAFFPYFKNIRRNPLFFSGIAGFFATQ